MLDWDTDLYSFVPQSEEKSGVNILYATGTAAANELNELGKESWEVGHFLVFMKTKIIHFHLYNQHYSIFSEFTH